MMDNLDDILCVLHKSKDEEEVIKNLKIIIKSFNISLYKELILSNPYFSSLIIDIKDDILIEITTLRDDIKSKIHLINDQLSKQSNQKDFIKLKDLKRQCIKLLFELDKRIREVDSLL
jgi:cystathionine beta-lyase family protein involved in aluminum resistance